MRGNKYLLVADKASKSLLAYQMSSKKALGVAQELVDLSPSFVNLIMNLL